MTAVSLFDLLVRDHTDQGDREDERMRLVKFAEGLVSSSLTDLERLRDYERQVASPTQSDPAFELELLRSIWQLYSAWAVEADAVFGRARSLMKSGVGVEGLDQLDSAIGRVQARLTVKPEQIAIAKEQVRQGHVIPAKELRDEFNTRLRA